MYWRYGVRRGTASNYPEENRPLTVGHSRTLTFNKSYLSNVSTGTKVDAMKESRPRKKRLFITRVHAYRLLDPIAHRYELESSADIPLTYYSDGSSQVHGDTIVDTALIPDREELVNLHLSRRFRSAPIYIAVSAADYEIHQQAIRTYQKDNLT